MAQKLCLVSENHIFKAERGVTVKGMSYRTSERSGHIHSGIQWTGAWWNENRSGNAGEQKFRPCWIRTGNFRPASRPFTAWTDYICSSCLKHFQFATFPIITCNFHKYVGQEETGPPAAVPPTRPLYACLQRPRGKVGRGTQLVQKNVVCKSTIYRLSRGVK